MDLNIKFEIFFNYNYRAYLILTVSSFRLQIMKEKVFLEIEK